MALSCGLLGLPNVGKSTLFNALSGAAAAAADYPFCTIDANIAEAPIPEPRLDVLARLASSATIIPGRLRMIDIAGLVRGAARGEGLGNRFLGHVREVDALVHVVRCFDGTTTHVEGRINPPADCALIETELLLSDIEILEKHLEIVRKRVRSGQIDDRKRLSGLEQGLGFLHDGTPLRNVMTEEISEALGDLRLITALPMMFAANVDENSMATGNEYSSLLEEYCRDLNAPVIRVSAAMEAELQSLDEAERDAYRAELGLADSGLERLLHGCARLLGLRCFFTAGPKEARAWNLAAPGYAIDAAGTIHSDFKKGFIRAETIAYDDYVRFGGESGARAAGRMRLEGANYVVADGDVLHFRFAL